jgi:hypothetical protein
MCHSGGRFGFFLKNRHVLDTWAELVLGAEKKFYSRECGWEVVERRTNFKCACVGSQNDKQRFFFIWKLGGQRFEKLPKIFLAWGAIVYTRKSTKNCPRAEYDCMYTKKWKSAKYLLFLASTPQG